MSQQVKTASSDRRARRTREALTNALMHLLKEKPLNAITVSELAREADINRATFYTHFQDVDDLFRSIQDDLCSVCRELIGARAAEAVTWSHEGLIHDVFEYFDGNVETFELVFNKGNDDAFFNNIMQIVYDSIITNLTPYEAAYERLQEAGYDGEKYRNLCKRVCDYQFNYAAGGVVSILRCWIEGGRVESVDQMTAIAYGCTKSISPKLLYDNTLALIKAGE